VKRSNKEKAFPGKWSVPGGKVEQTDYVSMKQNNGGLWYEVLEAALRREVLEEVNLEIKNTKYLTSIAYVRPDDAHCIIMSYYCDHASGDIKLCDALTDYAWVDVDEAKKYDLIDGIYDELVDVDKAFKSQ